jgi:TetR/AcrR family transcriptional regulator, cholesterol catabolism regulator
LVGLLDSISLTSDRFASVIPLELAVTFMVIRKAIGARPRENRRGAVLDSAARSFALHGYAGTSIRDIAADAGVQPSSLYYFFKSKDELYEAVYERGVEKFLDAVARSMSKSDQPWDRLERAAVAHLEALLEDGDYNTLVANIVPRGDSELDQRLVRHRDRYEAVFFNLIKDLPLPPRTDRKLFRLTFLSALNGVAGWYRDGSMSPGKIATKTVDLFRKQLEPDGERTAR